MHATTNLGLQVPDSGDNESAFPAVSSQQMTTLDAFSLLTAVVVNSTSATVARGQSVIASPSTTQTLPAATANAMVAIIASSTVTGASPVTVAGTHIYGIGLNNATSFLLGAAGASVVLQSDGTNWYIVTGQQDTGWVALTLATNVTSGGGYTAAARLVGDMVRLSGALSNQTGATINGTTIATAPAGCLPAKGGGFSGSCPNGTGTSISLTFNSLGQIMPQGNWANLYVLYLDGLSYRLS